MNLEISNFLGRFTSVSAEKTYGELYQYFDSSDFPAEYADQALTDLISWLNVQSDPVAKSYGYLFVGGLIDSQKLTLSTPNAEAIVTLIQVHADTICDDRIFDSEGHFIDYFSHLSYMFASFVDFFATWPEGPAFVDRCALCILAIYLKARQPFAANQHVFFAKSLLPISSDGLNSIVKQLQPVVVMQQADSWDVKAREKWEIAKARETNKSNLLFALFGINAIEKIQPQEVFEAEVQSALAFRFSAA